MNRETGLFFYFSNDLNHLFESISDNLKQAAPFQKKWIIVPAGAARNHLKQKICDDLGICMGIDFYSLQTGVSKILNLLYPLVQIPSQLELSLKLEQLIEKHLGEDKTFDQVYDYIGKEKKLSYFKSLSYLADQLATLFIQYALYCPNLKNQWPFLTDKKWQQKLWEKSLDRNNYYYDPEQVLQQKITPTCEQVSLYIVGYNYLPIPYLKLLKKAASFFHIQFFQTSPCAYFWSETKTDKERTSYLSYLKQKGVKENQIQTFNHYLLEQNPLLTQLGSIGRETLKLIEESQYPINENYFIPKQSLDHPFYSPWLTDSFSVNEQPLNLLQSLQLDLLIMRTDRNKIDCKKDNSIKIVQASSYEREVEVLYHYLLHLFDQDDQLKPSQVVVYLTNIQNYIPYIHNVFSCEGHNLDYFIYNNPFSESNQVLHALTLLLDLSQARWDKEKLISLFIIPAFKERFQLTDATLKKWLEWMDEVGLCWGIDRQDQIEKLKIHYNLMIDMDPKASLPCWQDFIESILKFMCSHTEKSALHPYLSQINFSDSDVLAQFIDIFSSLKSDLKQLDCNNKNNFQKWGLYVKCLLESYFQFELEQQADLLKVYETLDALSEAAQKLEDYEVSFETYYHHLKKQWQDYPAKSQEFQKESISFYSLQENTPISAKVVCLLGLNDEVFPKNIENPLNLIQEFPQSYFIPRKSDHARYLFLEILISTKKNLYLSYIGDCKKTFKAQLPSPLLIELQNYLDDYFLIEGQTPSKVLFELNSHLSFESHYFKNKHFSYRRHKLAKSYYQKPKKLEVNFKSQLIEKNIGLLTSDATPLKIKEIKDLLSLIRDPIQYFLKNKHHIVLDSIKPVHENKNFALNGYQKAILRKEILSYPDILDHEGLPKGVFKKVMMGILDGEKEQINHFLKENAIEREKFLTIELRADIEAPLLLKENYWIMPSIKIDTTEIVGLIDQISPQGLILNQKDNREGILKEWPKILVYQHLIKKMPQLGVMNFIFLKSQKIISSFVENEIEMLAQFLEYSHLCQDSLLPFLPAWIDYFLEMDAASIREKMNADLKSIHFYYEHAKALFTDYLPSLEQIESWKKIATAYFSKLSQELLK